MKQTIFTKEIKLKLEEENKKFSILFSSATSSEKRKFLLIFKKLYRYLSECNIQDKMFKKDIDDIENWLLEVNNFNFIKKHREVV